MQTESPIERAVMRRVKRARVLRPVIGAAPALALFLAALYGIGREVWVARVFENMPADALSAAGFFLQAFAATEATVQALVVALALGALWSARESLRALAAFAPPRFS